MISSIVQPCLDVMAAIYDFRSKKRLLIKREAKSLIEKDGPGAFETAQHVAALARQRGDQSSTELWLDVAGEIARRASNR